MTIAGNFSNKQITDFVWPEHFDTGDNPPAVQAFGEMMGKSVLSGEVGYALTKDRIAQKGGDLETKTGFGDEVDSKAMRPESSSFQFTEKRQEKFEIIDQERAQIEDVVGSDDPVDIAEFVGAAIRYQIWKDYHDDLNTVLTDTSTNESVAAANTWDSASGTPASDIHSADDAALGQIEVAIAGKDVARALQFSDPVREFNGAAIDATDGVVATEIVEDWLGTIFGINRFIVPELWFNQDNYQQAGMTPTRVFDGTMWLGSRSAVANLEHDNPEPEAETHRPKFSGKEIWAGTRTMEPHRVGDSRLGCVITSVV